MYVEILLRGVWRLRIAGFDGSAIEIRVARIGTTNRLPRADHVFERAGMHQPCLSRKGVRFRGKRVLDRQVNKMSERSNAFLQCLSSRHFAGILTLTLPVHNLQADERPGLASIVLSRTW